MSKKLIWVILSLLALVVVALIVINYSRTPQLSESDVRIKYNQVIKSLTQKQAEGYNTNPLVTDVKKARQLATQGELSEANDLLDEIDNKARSLTKRPSGGELTWEECIKDPRSKILLTFPKQCRYPDGGIAIEDSKPEPIPIPEPIPVDEIDVIKNLLVKDVLATYGGFRVAPDGAMSVNAKNGFDGVSFQRNGMFKVLYGISVGDKSQIEDGIRAMEYGLQFLESEGDFQFNIVLDGEQIDHNSVGPVGSENVSVIYISATISAFYMQAVAHAALAIQDSKYAGQYSSRFEALKPDMETAIDWLATEKAQAELKKQDRDAPNRLLFDALAYKLNGVYLERSDLEKIGDDFVQLALNMQWDNGIFPEGGGHDTAYHAVSIRNLDFYWLYMKDSSFRDTVYDAIESSADWSKSRVDPITGEIDTTGNTRTDVKGDCEIGYSGKCKEGNPVHTAESLAYWSVIGNDAEAAVLTSKILDFYGL